MEQEFCTCKEGCNGRCICSCLSSDRHWCSICKKTIATKPDTEKDKKARKKFLLDCHSIDDIIVKSLSSETEWLKYKKKVVA